MAQGHMVKDIYDLVLGAKNADNILSMPSLAEIQARNRAVRQARYDLNRQRITDPAWVAEQHNDFENYLADTYNGTQDLPSMQQYGETMRAKEQPNVMTRGAVPAAPTGYNLGGAGASANYADALESADADAEADSYLKNQYNLAFPNGNPKEETSPEDPQNPPASPAEGSDSTDPQQSAIEQRIASTNDIQGLLAILQELANMSPEEGGDPVFNLDAQFKRTSPMTNIGGTSAGLPQPRGDIMQTINLGNM